MKTFRDQDRCRSGQDVLRRDDSSATQISRHANSFQNTTERHKRLDVVQSFSKIVLTRFHWLRTGGEDLLGEDDNMRFLIMRNKFEVVKVILVESSVGKILLRELLQRFFVEDILKMFELRRSALPVR